MVQKLLWFAGAGAMGTLARYLFGGLVQRLTPAGFPWGTLAVNSLGCLIFGVIWALAEERFLIGSETRMVLLIGFLGSFTTFSSFAFETSQFVRDAQWTYALLNLLAHNIAGLAFVFIGYVVGRSI